MSKLTNKTLRQLLIDLGFEQGKVTDKKHRVFRHPQSGCMLLVPNNKSSEVPRPADLIGVKTHLAYQGHLDEEAFEHFVEHGELPANVK